MQFYRIMVHSEVCNDGEETRSRRAQRDDSQRISNYCQKITDALEEDGYFFLSFANSSLMTFGLISRKKLDVSKLVEKFLKQSRLKADDITIEETTFATLRQLLNDSERNGYVWSDDEVLRDYELEELTDGGRRGAWFHFEEYILADREPKNIRLLSERYFTRDSFEPELDRIFASPRLDHFVGHPVDYMVETNDAATKSGVTKLLLQALVSVGRLENKRYAELKIEPGNELSLRALSAIYRSNAGGTVVVQMDAEDEEDEDLAYGDLEPLENICEVARKHRRDVLTVFCMPRSCNNVKQKIFENMNGCTFVEIKEDQVYLEKAKEYLKGKAEANRIRTDKKLFDQLEEDCSYLTPELNRIFDEWYSKKLKTSIYKQYKDFSCVDAKVAKEKPKGSAYEELNEMIGLESAKRVINQALDSYKALKLFRDKGIVADECSNHMIFTGNPGTAKTTVARLFARILKDNDIIESSRIVEVGRGDLVGKYVGWTAPTIQKKFKEAQGGVLFIDEAYSLVDDRDGSFGDEAINTIVQEMENHRGDVIVIFAGYPDKMEGFLQKNPGLRSRIAHHVHFENYKPDELCDIARLIAKNKGMKLDEAAVEKLHGIFEQAVLQDDFGNGRYVRNVIEKAKMVQNSRLVHMDVESVTQDDIKRITAEDIEMPIIGAKQEKRKIGFAV